MAANGIMYSASLKGVSVSNNAQNIFEFIAAPSVSFLIHSIRLDFVPSIVSGVAVDTRAALSIQGLSTTGTGGTAVVPAPVLARNTVAAVTTVNSLVTSPGTLSVVKSALNPSINVPFERIFTSDQRIPVTGGGRLAINLATALGLTVVVSSEIYFEEF